MKAVTAHALLALLGLAFAYQTFTREEKDEPVAGEVTISECPVGEVAEVDVESPTHTVQIKADKLKDGTAYWVTTQRKKVEPKKDEAKKDDAKKDDAKKDEAKKDEPAKPATADKNAKPEAKGKDAAAEKKPEPPAKPEPPKQPRAYDPDAPVNFLASPKFLERLQTLAPLRAMRAVGKVSDKQLADFGLDKVGTYLRISCGGRKLALDVGGRTYGLSDQYVRDPKTKQVYLLNGQMVMDLESAQFKFMQTDLHNFPLAEVDSVVIKSGGKERKLLHRNRLNPEDARWVDAAAPDKRNELFGNWFQRLEHLRAKSFLDAGKEPGSDLQIEATGTTPVLNIEYELEGKKQGNLELVRVDTAQGGLYYARTEATHRWVTMYDSQAKQLEDDSALVVGAEPSASAPDAQSKAPGASSPAPPAAPKPATVAAPAAAPKTPAPAALPPKAKVPAAPAPAAPHPLPPHPLPPH
jgi:hypothetical protein